MRECDWGGEGVCVGGAGGRVCLWGGVRWGVGEFVRGREGEREGVGGVECE